MIQGGPLARAVLAHFESEKQALALMGHSSIARVFDAGVTDEGVPYFVMEYVDGEPIGVHCDRDRLPLAERLRVFEAYRL